MMKILGNLPRDAETENYRNELKYICSESELLQIEMRIAPLCRKDTHAGSNGIYEIRSIYFDDNHNHCYYENEDGVNPREKFRIRMYNTDSSFLCLECKRKENGMTHKDSCRISKEKLDKILSENMELEENAPPLLARFTLQYLKTHLRPKLIVSYDRTPYIYDLGNVRITVDRNIAGCTDVNSFYDQRLMTRPVMQTGQHILEVKYDYVLPEVLYRLMNIKNLRRTAFSKYYLCRKYTEQGERL